MQSAKPTIMKLLVHDWQIFARIAVHLDISAKRRKLTMYDHGRDDSAPLCIPMLWVPLLFKILNFQCMKHFLPFITKNWLGVNRRLSVRSGW
jgi:hypothetical protein